MCVPGLGCGNRDLDAANTHALSSSRFRRMLSTIHTVSIEISLDARRHLCPWGFLSRRRASARSRAVSVRTSAIGANARSAGGRASARTSARGAHARSAGGRASVSTSASGAIARSAGARASARTSARGAIARSAGARAFARTSARGAHVRSAECKPQGLGRPHKRKMTRRGL